MFGGIRCLFQLMHDFFDFDKLYTIFFFLEKLRDKNAHIRRPLGFLCHVAWYSNHVT